MPEPGPDDLRGALEAIDRILNRGSDADDVLREVLAVLHRHYAYAAVAFVENEELVVGPEAGSPAEPLAALPVAFRGAPVAELRLAPAPGDDPGRAFAQRVALLISPYCLVGWDTGGEPWPEESPA